jgi:hypothetical protein
MGSAEYIYEIIFQFQVKYGLSLKLKGHGPRFISPSILGRRQTRSKLNTPVFMLCYSYKEHIQTGILAAVFLFWKGINIQSLIIKQEQARFLISYKSLKNIAFTANKNSLNLEQHSKFWKPLSQVVIPKHKRGALRIRDLFMQTTLLGTK